MTVVAPGDPTESAAATRAIIARPGPCYLRLGRAGEPIVHPAEIDFQIGKAIRLREGNDLTLISTGGLLATAVDVAQILNDHGISSRVLSMHTIKPLDEDAVLEAARETNAIATLEEHSILGGLGGAVAEVLAEGDAPKRPFVRIGLESGFVSQAGDQEYLRAANGLSSEKVAQRLLSLVGAGP
jgi:transketolase